MPKKIVYRAGTVGYWIERLAEYPRKLPLGFCTEQGDLEVLSMYDNTTCLSDRSEYRVKKATEVWIDFGPKGK